ncbi:TerD family protein [Pseudonocardia lacus]|uniref:TerD family protein n=1 Tax=Pseudonocardia lacus TaxID=2835865 RepID=UPI001BDD43EE|nr:TerD family protein [Pseudonocardia lacus]
MDHPVLVKGANISLLPESEVAGAQLQVVVEWADPKSAADVDVSALLLGGDGRVRSDEDFVFYNAPVGGEGAVRLVGKRSADDRGDDRVAVDLEALPDAVSTVVIAASLDAEPGLGFGTLAQLSLTVTDSAGATRLSYDVTDAGPETAMVIGELYLRAGHWKFRAIGQGWASGLAGLATDYGITVDNEPDVDAEPAPDHEPAPAALTATVASEPHTVAAEPGPGGEPTGIVGVAADEPAGPDDIVVVAAEQLPDGDAASGQIVDAGVPDVAVVPPGADAVPDPRGAGRSRAPRRGVATRKRRTTAATLARPTLAEQDTWQPARLFSISGVGAAAEQEKRATSTLLSTMVAVRDFGRALVSRFGGPAGTIETYLEVQYKLDDRTVIPDGVIRVARAGRIWTALLEVKTGTSSLRTEQVEQYLDVAQRRKYDAVITLSNDIAPVGGAHPVAVDGRKLRKVALHHISWSEVLHEAQMQLAHRGLDDRLQAWVLAELIRYLEHPKSGAAGFDDMGTAWVAVREAVVARTLRATDRKTESVAAAWEKLVRHLSMRLTSQLGVAVGLALPRKQATDHNARLQEAINGLAADGVLRTTLRIPDAVGPVTVIADLRTSQIRTSIEIDAPREGTAKRRVAWLLRQLGEAPDQLSVEVLFARRDQTSCELLKDVRTDEVTLLPDPSAEVRAFRLTLSAPMGTKRNGLSKAFIPSVHAAVDTFYAHVVQGLRPWPAVAPKLPTAVADEAAEVVEDLARSAAGQP